MKLDSNWKDGKTSLPIVGKEVLWYIKIKQDNNQYYLTRHYPFWVENVYTVITNIKKDSNNDEYIALHLVDGREFRLLVHDDFKSLISCHWTELPIEESLIEQENEF